MGRGRTVLRALGDEQLHELGIDHGEGFLQRRGQLFLRLVAFALHAVLACARGGRHTFARRDGARAGD